MKVYNYHPIHRTYTGESDAEISPLDKHSFIIPLNSTTSKPPNIPDGYVAVYDLNEWALIKNDGLINKKEINYPINDIQDKNIIELQQLVADLTEIVLLGGVE